MDIQTLTIWASLCLQCAPNVHPATTTAIISVESGGNPYAINDNTTKRSYKLHSKEEAAEKAYELLKLGHNIDMGLMQVNSCHLKPMRINYNDLFDPCFNINTGANILVGFFNKNNRPNQDPQETLLKALSAYNTGSPYNGYYNGYVSKILKSTNKNFYFFSTRPQNTPTYQTVSVASNETPTDATKSGTKTRTTPNTNNALQNETETLSFIKKPGNNPSSIRFISK